MSNSHNYLSTAQFLNDSHYIPPSIPKGDHALTGWLFDRGNSVNPDVKPLSKAETAAAIVEGSKPKSEQA